MKQANRNKRLQSRIADWAQRQEAKDRPPSGIQKRIETGGYRKPGSNSK